MVPDLTLEVIYFKQPTDFKMEFDLCGNCNLRFLSFIAKEKNEFLSALGKGVARSRAIIAVGSFSPLDDEYLPKIISRAIGYKLKPINRDELSVVGALDYSLPDTAIPLVTENGVLGGCVLENNDQSIILLTTDRKIRHKIVKDLVCPYLQIFAGRGIGHTTVKVPIEEPIVDADFTVEEAVTPAEALSAENTVTGETAESIYTPPVVPPLDTADLTAGAILAMVDDDIKAEALKAKALEEETSAEPQPVEASQPEEETKAEAEADMAAEEEKIPVAVAAKEEASPLSDTETEKKDGGATDTDAEEVERKEESGEDELFNLNAVITPPETPTNRFSYTVLAEPENETEARRSLQEFLADEYDEELKTSKKRKRKRIFKVILSFVIIIVVLCSSYFGYEWVYQPMQNASIYADIEEMYGQTWEGLPEDMLCEFGKLYQTNKDIYGWISIPETNINYPVVTAVNKGAAYYDGHAFDGSVNRFGTPYIDDKLSKYEYTANTVIYGANTKEDIMFSDLKKYTDIEHYRKAPVFSFNSVYVENRWKIFAVIKINSENEEKYVRSSFFDDKEFLSYITFIKKSSVITTNIDVSAEDKLITLVTKGGENRVAVIARRVRSDESPLVEIDSKLNDQLTDEDNVISEPSYFQEISPEEIEDSAMLDGQNDRYEQPEPEQDEQVEIKPNSPGNVSSEASGSSDVQSSGRVEGSSSVTSSQVVTSSRPSSKPPVSSSKVESGGVTKILPVLTVTNNFDGKKYSGPANEIVARILEAEMGSHYHIEALKAQAVAAYSWLLCNGAASGKAPSAPLKNPGEKAIQAADAVAGEVAIYGGKVAQTYYYAISAGKTANSDDIWTSKLPYLTSVDSSVDKNISGFETIRKYAAEDVKAWVKAQLGIDLSSINKNEWFKCQYDENNLYVEKVTIGDKTVKGTYLRNSLFTAARVGSKNVLRSSAYQISYSGKEDEFTFTVRGYGHGVGMSQVGANAYAKSGWNYKSILSHYYTGISFGTYYDE